MRITAEEARANKTCNRTLEIVYEEIKRASRNSNSVTILLDCADRCSRDKLNNIEKTLQDDGYTASWRYNDRGLAEFNIHWG